MAALRQSSSILKGNLSTVMRVARRNIGISSIAMAKLDKNVDPIQRLFVEKLQAYKQKSKGGKLVDATPEMEANTAKEIEQIKKRFGGGNLEEIPKFSFDDK